MKRKGGGHKKRKTATWKERRKGRSKSGDLSRRGIQKKESSKKEQGVKEVEGKKAQSGKKPALH